MSNPAKFRFSVDRGGTFTDVYAEVSGSTGHSVIFFKSETRTIPEFLTW